MKPKTTKLILTFFMTMILFLLLPGRLFAQADSVEAALPNSPNGGSEKFVLANAASAMFMDMHMKMSNGMMSSTSTQNYFKPMMLMVMPLCKLNEKLFVESGFKMELNDAGDGFNFGVETLTLHYQVCPDMSAFIGKFPAKFGNYLDLLGEGFVSRFPTDAVGMADAGMGPTDRAGAGIEGCLQAGYSKVIYYAYVANSPELIIDSTTALTNGNMTGHLNYDNLLGDNNSKSIGWRLGFLPFSNSSLQLDFSGQYTPETGPKETNFQNIKSTSWAVDMNYYHSFNPIMVRLMGQYESTQTDNFNYPIILNDTSRSVFTFKNSGNAWYGGLTLRAASSASKFLSNIEIGIREGAFNPPKDAPWGGDPSTQTTICLAYWLRWDCPIDFAYDIIKQGNMTQNMFVTRIVYRF